MSHSLANLEYHHFKYESHRRAGDVHIHFFGADAFSFGEGIALKDGDVLQPEQEVARVEGDPVQVAKAEERIIGALSKSSGIATAAKTACEKAGNGVQVVSGGCK